MKIAFAMINCNRRDGSARPVNEVAERLARRGHDVHLFARKAEDIDLGLVHWHRVPGPAWPEIADFASYHWTVGGKIRAGKFDIVHSIGCNAPEANVITIQNIQPAKQRILDHVGRAEKVSLPRRFSRWLYLRTTAVAEQQLYTYQASRRPVLFLPVSRGVEAELRAHYEIGPSVVRIVPNAADTERFQPLSPAHRTAWRQAQGIAATDILLLFAGGEWARKGLDIAIHALALLPDHRMKLFVAGDDPDRTRYLKMSAELGLRDRIVFGGFRRDVETAMGAADIFLFPSRYEAFSLATIEAAACGLPIVAARINGTEDFIQPGLNGEFVEHDAGQIATTLRQLGNQPDRLSQMGAAGRQLVLQNYTWERVAQLTEQAYREYIDREAARDRPTP